ncbi:MAG TPA: chloride channel protein [Bacteroidia bacterium]|nr:chloride channel protein [Bacteroidia bacterium]
MRFILKLIFRANKLVIWIQHSLSPKQFVIFSAILIGLTAGLAAVLLKLVVHFLIKSIESLSYDSQVYTAMFPIVGIALCVLFIHYMNRNKLGKGIANILYAIAKKSSLLPKDQTYSHVISSALTVGFGGSAGLESPIVTTGAAIGSNFGQTYKLNYKERTLLLACGAAAGIAGAFNTPIAGVLFALEVLLVEANISAFIPILIAAAAGGLCSKIILQEDVLLHFSLQEPFDYLNVPFYLLLGLLAGVCSYYYGKVFMATENYFKRFENNKFVKVLIGGAGLFVLVLFVPPLFGEGYLSIKLLSDINPGFIFKNSILPLASVSKPVLYIFLLLVIILKPIATGLTLGSGGNGGNFAPSLFVGAFLGFLFSSVMTDLGIPLPVSNFTIVAMAGILSGIFHAPLTGIFLIAEITGGYELIIPLMIVSALSYAVSKYFMPLSIDMLKLSDKEKIVTTNTDSYLLSNINLAQFVEEDFSEVMNDMNLRGLVEAIALSKRNIFPVVDKEGGLKGLITIDDIRDIMFKQDLYDKVTVKELMRRPNYLITEKDDISSAMKLFDESHLWNIPVVFNGKYKGFISKSTILEKYREVLIQSSIE